MTDKDKQPASTSNFLRNIIESDLASGTYASRTWGGKPGPASAQAGASPDPWKIRTRFPPEPNGYLHIGHAKSICLNFGLALDYGGVCHLRFDDTNPVTENIEYVDTIIESVKWLGFDWHEHLYFASDYFDDMYRFAEMFIEHGLAYVDSLTPDQIREYRGTLTEPGRNSPDRDSSSEQNLKRFHEMRDGLHPDGSLSLRLKIDMASPNINMRDPVIYRIRHAHHHRSGDKWCVYPMYDYTHCISDALENITHSICTLEFEDHRPLYNWILEKLADFGVLSHPLPHQYEFSRLNLTYVVLSKRRLIQLVTEEHVSGWDDPRMPTLVGARRRGYTPEGFRLFAERIGVSKADSWIDYSILEDCMREVLNESAPRRIAVLEPLKLIIDNYPAGQQENCSVPNHPQKPEWGTRELPLSGELWIERGDFAENPPKGYFRLFPGNTVRLRYGYVVKCTGCDKDADGNVTAVHCDYFPDSRSGTAGANNYKVKGNIHWLCARNAATARVHLYDRLFLAEHPGREHDFLEDLNPDSKTTIDARVEPLLGNATANDRFQFERHGYFTADSVETANQMPVFNRTVTLRDSWAKQRK
ncbi:MAG: glutamine--tRNA ligase/YqeY domain fusion protein [Burkholderiales bacterium]